MYPSIECEVTIGHDGTVKLPATLVRRFRKGTRLTLRITDGTISSKLRMRNVTEAEVEHVASIQLEEREAVIKFLEVEGAISTRSLFARRAHKLFGLS
jgi:hypothetical protein